MNNGILIPKYYDPRILRKIAKLAIQGKSEFVSLGELCDNHEIEILSAASSARSEEYDLHGSVRFIRTADVSSYELNARPQKMVSDETYEKYKDKQDLRKRDILYVKDGDNKIGEMAILLDDMDLRILVQTHFKIIRPVTMDSFLLLWALSTPIVREQIRQRVFIQSTLGTIGNRIMEIRIPIPKKAKKQRSLANNMKKLVLQRRLSLKKIHASVTDT